MLQEAARGRGGRGRKSKRGSTARGCCTVTGRRPDFASTRGRVPVARGSATNAAAEPRHGPRSCAARLTRGERDSLAVGGKVALHVAAEGINEGLQASWRARQRRRHAPGGGRGLGRGEARRASEHRSTAFEGGHVRVTETPGECGQECQSRPRDGSSPQQIDGHSAALLQDRAPPAGATATRAASCTSRDGLPERRQRPVGCNRRGGCRDRRSDMDAFPVALRLAILG